MTKLVIKDEQTQDVLKRFMKVSGVETEAHVIRDALGVYAALYDELEKAGPEAELAIVVQDKYIQRLNVPSFNRRPPALVLSPADQELVALAILAEDQEPNEALRRAFARHKELVGAGYAPLQLTEEEAAALRIGFRDELASAYRMTETHAHDSFWQKRFEILRGLGKRLGVEW